MDYLHSFHAFSRFLSDAGIVHWVDFGTLLGAVRNGNMIPGDRDFDIDLFSDQVELLIRRRNEIYQRFGFRLVASPTKGILRCLPDHEGLNMRSDRDAVRSCERSRVPYIDLYCCEVDGKDVVHPVTQFRFKLFFVQHLSEVAIGGHLFPCPVAARLLLRNRYGDDWRVPLGFVGHRRVQYEIIREFPSEVRCMVFGVFDPSRDSDRPTLELLTSLFDDVVIAVIKDSYLDWVGQKSSLPDHGRASYWRQSMGCRVVLVSPDEFQISVLEMYDCFCFALIPDRSIGAEMFEGCSEKLMDRFVDLNI